jgi:cell division inhibitor SulA
MNTALQKVLNHPAIWRGESVAPTAQTFATGYSELDALLPGAGWPRGALTELLVEREGIGELQLLFPLLAHLTQADKWAVLVTPPHLPYAPALAQQGINLSRIVVVSAEATKDRWWAAEQAARAGSCSAVLFWPGTTDERRLRRLHSAAEAGKTACFMYGAASRALQSSPAPLRLGLEGAATQDALCVRLLKRRGSAIATPLLLPISAPTQPSRREAHYAEPIQLPLLARRRNLGSARFNKAYANGADDLIVRDRGIVHADERKRSMPDTDRRALMHIALSGGRSGNASLL